MRLGAERAKEQRDSAALSGHSVGVALVLLDTGCGEASKSEAPRIPVVHDAWLTRADGWALPHALTSVKFFVDEALHFQAIARRGRVLRTSSGVCLALPKSSNVINTVKAIPMMKRRTWSPAARRVECQLLQFSS